MSIKDLKLSLSAQLDNNIAVMAYLSVWKSNINTSLLDDNNITRAFSIILSENLQAQIDHLIEQQIKILVNMNEEDRAEYAARHAVFLEATKKC